MSEESFAQIDEVSRSGGAAAAVDRLLQMLRDQQEYHRLFDALLLQKKLEMGLPLSRPTSFDDVPEEQQESFKQYYVVTAREIGRMLLAADDIPQAWIYFRTIGENDEIARAIDAVEAGRDADEQTEELIQIALYEGANPVKGLELMLNTHGTCNTITALDQGFKQLTPADRKRAAAMLVNTLYEDLSHTLRSEIEQRMPMLPPGTSIRELITGRDWLFAEGNYHIDVSHLHAVVRFSRSLEPDDAELIKATELAEYGSKLDQQFQYAGDPPFDDFYAASVEFFKVISGDGRDEALAYFRKKLESQPEPEDKQLIAYVMVDLLVRCGQCDKAIDLAEEYLQNIDESSGFSFAELCEQAGRMDTLRKVAREKGDLVGYTAALLQEGAETVSS